MAGQEDLLNRIRSLIAGFDDAAWEALANKGLLRRARKDLEKGQAIEIQGQSEGSLLVIVPPFVVAVPPTGPAKATCTCPSPGMCQHILAACLHLQSAAVASVEATPAAAPVREEQVREEIVSITVEQLKKWAGAAEYRGAVFLFESATQPPVIETGDTVTVSFRPTGIEARYVPGGGLDGMIVPKMHGKRIAVAAILALRQKYGLALPQTATQASLIDTSGAPRTRDEVLAAAASVIENTITVGLTHVSSVMADRLATLAVSALGVNLPRVSLGLKAVADEIRAIISRNARADEGRLLLLMARIYALLEAIRRAGENPPLQLIGTSRAQYLEVADLELHGIGAYPWQTVSGYKGVTLLFWAPKTREVLSWSQTRPASQKFDPYARFHGEGPWEGTQSPSQVSASRLMLRKARRTANGRLSSSTRTSALVLGSTAPASLEFEDRGFSRWGTLWSYCMSKQPMGLTEANPLDLVVVLEPAAYGQRTFAVTSQTFAWQILDDAGEVLVLSLPFREWTKEAIDILEGLTPPEPASASGRWKIVARISVREDALVAEPVSILMPEAADKPVFHLAFDTVPQTSPAVKGSGREEEEEEADVEPEEEQDTPIEELSARGGRYFQSVLAEINRRLEAIAEAGCQGELYPHTEWFSSRRQDLYAAGLTCISGALEPLGGAQSLSASAVLAARYLTYLHNQAAAVGAT